MHSFHFRLQTLLELRRLQTEAEEKKLSEMVALRTAMESRRQELHRTDAEARASLSRSLSPRPSDLQAVARYSAHVIEASEALVRRIREQDGKIEAQRRVVYERRRNEELLEKLREEDLEAWTHAMELELEGLAADSYIAAWNRRNNARKRLPAGEDGD
jgi:flagellar export protein FliJ